jgi:oxepin-CoA hydrolase/3-oxo-5,6-dehydrosuberyl-CoA semialdehyde dehydrogenase
MNTNAPRFADHVPHPATVLSRAAGPSRAERRDVHAPKGPVLLNYGIEECRFLKPLYPGSTIQVKFTCREKLDQEKRPKTEDSPKGADVARGIVKWLVDVVDEMGETVASRGLGSDDLDDGEVAGSVAGTCHP